jgi:hypothetical protein
MMMMMMMASNNKTVTTRSSISSSSCGDKNEKAEVICMSSINCGLPPSLFTIQESIRESEATKEEEEEHLLHPIIIRVECLGCCKHIVHYQQQETHHSPNEKIVEQRKRSSLSWSVGQQMQHQYQQQQVQIQIRKLRHRISRWDTDSTRSILSTSTSSSSNNNNKSVAIMQPQQQQQQQQRQRSSCSIDSPPVSPIRQKSINTYKYQNGDRVVSFAIPIEL